MVHVEIPFSVSKSPSDRTARDGVTHARGITVICLTLLWALFELRSRSHQRNATARTQMQLMRPMLENPVSSREDV